MSLIIIMRRYYNINVFVNRVSEKKGNLRKKMARRQKQIPSNIIVISQSQLIKLSINDILVRIVW